MTHYPNPKMQIRPERPQFPAMGVNWVDKHGVDAGKLIRRSDGKLVIIGHHGLTYAVSEADFRHFCEERAG